MPAQAAPAAGVSAAGAEHPGNNPEEGSHGLPAARGIQGEQIGPGRFTGRLISRLEALVLSHTITTWQ